MINLRTAFIVFILLGVCSGQNSTSVNETSVAPAPTRAYDCRIYNPHCDDNGVCQSDGTCRCYNGYFGLLNNNRGGSGDSCPYSVIILPDVYDTYIYGTRVYQGVIYSILTLLTVYRLILQYFISGSNKNTSVSIVWWILCLILLHSILGLLPSVDYWGMSGRISYPKMLVLFLFSDPSFVLIFSSLLFHWAESYYSSVKKMKKEQMSKKIKPGYQSNLTIEEVISKMHFLSKFRFAYLALAILSFAVYIGECAVNLTTKHIETADAYFSFYSIFFVVVWILFGVGYLIYGIRLIQIMPNGLSIRIKSTMVCSAMFAITSIVYNCTVYASSLKVKDLTAIYEVYAWSTSRWICAFSASNICMPVWEWNRWFSPSLIKSLGSTSRTSNHTSSEVAVDKSMGIDVEQSTQNEVPMRKDTTEVELQVVQDA